MYFGHNPSNVFNTGAEFINLCLFSVCTLFEGESIFFSKIQICLSYNHVHLKPRRIQGPEINLEFLINRLVFSGPSNPNIWAQMSGFEDFFDASEVSKMSIILVCLFQECRIHKLPFPKFQVPQSFTSKVGLESYCAPPSTNL